MNERSRHVLTTAPGGRSSIGSVVITVATARNQRPANGDAIGINGWLLAADDVNPLDLSVPVVEQRAALVAVTAGLSLAGGGDAAAAIAARRLTARGTQREANGKAMGKAFREADDLIHRAAETGHAGMGCSAAAVLIRSDGRALVANVGDVRLYQERNGYLGAVTRDDRTGEGGSVLTRCLGGRLRTDVDVHLAELAVGPGDRLLLCSDGIWEVLPHPEIEHAVNTWPAGHAVATLVKAAKERRKDGGDITLALLRLVGPQGRGTGPPLTGPPTVTGPLAELPARPRQKRTWRDRLGLPER